MDGVAPRPGRCNMRLCMSPTNPPASLLGPEHLARLDELLGGEPSVRALPVRAAPVHVVYGGAHLFKATTVGKLGALARQSLDEYSPGGDDELAAAFGLPATVAGLRRRVADKLAREPVEDYRIDFEDGYGQRPDEEEDGHADACALEVAQAAREGLLPAGCGIRIKSLATPTRQRALRTLDRFFGALRAVPGGYGVPPAGFVVTLPKVTRGAEPAALAHALGAIESAANWPQGSIGIELMIETPEAIVAHDGRLAPRSLVEAAGGRCVAVHFGTYDYTASLGVASVAQRPDHGACQLARRLLVVALAGTSVRVSDGATTTLPVAPHRAKDALTDGQRSENRAAIQAAWSLHTGYITAALTDGIYQGWDLHPAQLPARYVAVFAFFRAAAPAAGERLRNFLDRAAQASRLGTSFDDAATGQGLLNLFRRALSSGALDADEVSRLTGLSPEALTARSFDELVAR